MLTIYDFLEIFYSKFTNQAMSSNENSSECDDKPEASSDNDSSSDDEDETALHMTFTAKTEILEKESNKGKVQIMEK